ncbi:MAG: NAD-dependent DNA ligase LigA, partial [Bacteroidales bacterium]|nr:NAD-dependent DNA ligase LigA [Bacteroidales bacterium]
MKISKEQANYRISFLKDEINKHNRRYYIDNQPSVSDFEFDLLMQELQTLESKFPQFSSEDSPTKKVGSDLASSSESGIAEVVKSINTDKPREETTLSNQFRQIAHKYPMLSLSNTYDKEELLSFNERVERTLGIKSEYVCELKIDGTAISLSYNNCRLVSAVTRGDGTVGDDVTENVKTTGVVPLEIPLSSPVRNFEIRGEIFMPWDSFDLINQRREANEEQLFANPRNAAAGSLKLQDSSEVASRGLKLILYNVITEVPFFQNHLASLQWAKECGFPVSEHTSLCNSIVEVIEYLDKWDLKRKELSYPTDGVVIKVNNIDYQNALGITSKFPRWATAYKFKAEQALTRLISIDYQVGRTGAVTPVANLEPVTLSGSTVRRASLHNSEQMKLLDIHLDDMVFIEKGGEIIPKITGVNISKRDKSAIIPQFPEICPDCGTVLMKDSEEAKHFCPNSEQCPTQIKGRFLHFSGRKAMNILIGEATIDQMYRLGYLKRLPDLYKIDKEQLLKLDGWKERSVTRFTESLQD